MNSVHVLIGFELMSFFNTTIVTDGAMIWMMCLYTKQNLLNLHSFQNFIRIGFIKHKQNMEEYWKDWNHNFRKESQCLEFKVQCSIGSNCQRCYGEKMQKECAITMC